MQLIVAVLLLTIAECAALGLPSNIGTLQRKALDPYELAIFEVSDPNFTQIAKTNDVDTAIKITIAVLPHIFSFPNANALSLAKAISESQFYDELLNVCKAKNRIDIAFFTGQYVDDKKFATLSTFLNSNWINATASVPLQNDHYNYIALRIAIRLGKHKKLYLAQHIAMQCLMAIKNTVGLSVLVDVFEHVDESMATNDDFVACLGIDQVAAAMIVLTVRQHTNASLTDGSVVTLKKLCGQPLFVWPIRSLNPLFGEFCAAVVRNGGVNGFSMLHYAYQFAQMFDAFSRESKLTELLYPEQLKYLNLTSAQYPTIHSPVICATHEKEVQKAPSAGEVTAAQDA